MHDPSFWEQAVAPQAGSLVSQAVAQQTASKHRPEAQASAGWLVWDVAQVDPGGCLVSQIPAEQNSLARQSVAEVQVGAQADPRQVFDGHVSGIGAAQPPLVSQPEIGVWVPSAQLSDGPQTVVLPG
jgi:hypothetical protein